MTKSLTQLESESADFRTAKDNAVAEVTRLQDHRKRLLLTVSVDEILALDDDIRRQEIAGEIAQAKADALRGDLYWARENAKRYSGVAMPTDIELAKLLDIVVAAHPGDFRDNLEEFRRAFYSVGRLGRLPEPSADRYFMSTVDDANEILRAHRLQTIEGDMLLCAAIAWGDVLWRAPDTAMGGQLEISLAKLHSGSPAKPKWREILAGKANLLAPLPPRSAHASSSTYPVPRMTIRYGDGREVDPAAPLGVQ
jgi:hypothetical protein